MTGSTAYSIINANCLDALAGLDLVDAVVTDPPYGLDFMGKDWDHGIPGVKFWEAILGAMKPGAHLLAFGGTRTYHRLVCAIEDAGFEIRDCLMWVYGTGFPKSLNVGKAIDKAANVERKYRDDPRWAGKYPKGPGGGEPSPMVKQASRKNDGPLQTSDPATDAAKQWDGWGTALKPAWEPIIVARKPLDGTVAANVLEHGTGALNIDGCRVSMAQADADFIRKTARPNTAGQEHDGDVMNLPAARAVNVHSKGRWPANVIHDGSEEVLAGFPEAARPCGTPKKTTHRDGMFHTGQPGAIYSDSGSTSRFFYCAKASKKDRGEGNDHPTVKPRALMRYLCRLVTPPGGVVLDPFMGSGSTLLAAQAEGFRSVGIDTEAHYCEIAGARLKDHVLATRGTGDDRS